MSIRVQLRRVVPVALSVAAIAATASPHALAQGPPPGTPLHHVLANDAIAESLAVLRGLDERVRGRSRDAAAWHRRGMVAWALLYRARNGPAHSELDWTRLARAADSSLRIAAQLAPGDAQIQLHTAQYYLSTGQTAVRVQAYAMIGRAVTLARQARNAPVLADALVEQGRLHWRRYDALANRRIDPGDGFARSLAEYVEQSQAQATASGAPVEIPIDHVVDRLNRGTQPLPANESGAADYERAELHFRDAYERTPDNARAFGQLAMLLAEKRRWVELTSLARDRLLRTPSDAHARLVLGLALHRQRRTDDAAREFETALAALPPSERARVTSLRRVLTPPEQRHYDESAETERARNSALYWRVNDPLWSRGGDDARTEYIARAVYADLRWTVEELGVRGLDSDRGEIHARYGPPDLEAVVGPNPSRGDIGPTLEIDANRNRTGGAGATRGGGSAGFGIPRAPGANEMLSLTSVTTYWAYRQGMLFVFRGAPTYATARFPAEDGALVDSIIRATPAQWRNATDETLLEMPAHVARFRATADSVDVVVAADPLVAAIREASTANAGIRTDFWLFGRDNATSFHDSATVRTTDVRAWTSRLAPGVYGYRIESTADGTLVAGRATDWIGASAGTPDGAFALRGFGLSDILLVSSATAPATARRWHELNLAPASGTIRVGGDIGLVWETYDLGASAAGAEYTVTITIERRYREVINRIRARVIGAMASLAGVERTSDRVIFRYDRVTAHAPTVVDHIGIGLDESPPGEYRISLAVTDKATGRTAERTQRLLIRE